MVHFYWTFMLIVQCFDWTRYGGAYTPFNGLSHRTGSHTIPRWRRRWRKNGKEFWFLFAFHWVDCRLSTATAMAIWSLSRCMFYSNCVWKQRFIKFEWDISFDTREKCAVENTATPTTTTATTAAAKKIKIGFICFFVCARSCIRVKIELLRSSMLLIYHFMRHPNRVYGKWSRTRARTAGSSIFYWLPSCSSNLNSFFGYSKIVCVCVWHEQREVVWRTTTNYTCSQSHISKSTCY